MALDNHISAIILVALGYGGILLQARSELDWIKLSSLNLIVKPLFRIGVSVWTIAFFTSSLRGTIATTAVFIATGFIVVIVCLRWRELVINFHPDMPALMPPYTIWQKINAVLLGVGGAVAQEIFYRGVVISALKGLIGVWSIVIAALLFMVEHSFHFDAKENFDRLDYVLQLCLGLVNGVIFYFYDSLALCIILHIVYNLPSVQLDIRRATAP